MAVKSLIRNLIIGKNRFLPSYGEFRQAMLTGYMALLAVVVCFLYIILDQVAGYTQTLPLYILMSAIFIGTIYLQRHGHYRLAKFILLPTLSLAIFIFASSEDINGATFIYFLSVCIVAFAVSSHREKKFAILFSVFNYILFLLSCYYNFTFLPERVFTEDFLITNAVINFTIALPSTVMCVSLLIELNHYNAVQLLERNEQLKKTNSELDRFVYSTSHDLRAPLTSLMGLINITSNTTKPDELQHYLQMMKDRVHSLDKFIKDITDYSRNNRLEITHEKVKLTELAEEVWESLKFAPEAFKIEFETDIAGDIVVESDKNRLKVIISNLVSNAIRYHDARKARQFIRLSAELRENVFYLKVQDNGQGIAAEYHSRIFEMFYRANEQSKGSGLGLYIVKEALMKLSGTIQLDSSPGIGSTFTVRLPSR